MMELYKQHKINPFGGCLPILFQTPIWIALYTMLWRGVELYRAPFFAYYTDLSSADPYFVLPLLLGVTMFVQQKITPTTMDEAQQKMMLYFMPIMFTVFMLFLPAGLCLYSLVNSLLTIGQQRLLYRGQPPISAAPAARPAAAPPEEGRQSRRAGRKR
jgi:YidC/Oxa1 family membrane protein insertase